MPKFICISGKAGHGKDTLAEILRCELENSGKTVLVTHFADLLKYICSNYFAWNGLKDERGRSLLQYVGTDIVRKRNPNYWVNFIVQLISMFKDEWDYVIIPDARFPNELAQIKKKFDLVHVRVVRGVSGARMTVQQLAHESETALDGIEPDYLVDNTGSFDHLREQARSLLSNIRFAGDDHQQISIFDEDIVNDEP